MILVILICAAISGIIGLAVLLKGKRRAHRRLGVVLLTGAAIVYLLALASIVGLAALWR